MSKKILIVIITVIVVIACALFFLPLKAVSITKDNFNNYIDFTSTLSNPEPIDFTKVKSTSCECKVYKDTMSSTFTVETKINKKFARVEKLNLIYPLPNQCFVSGDCVSGVDVKIPITSVSKQNHKIDITSTLPKEKFQKSIETFTNPLPAVEGVIRVPVISF